MTFLEYPALRWMFLMKKNILAISLLAASVFAVTACGGDDKKGADASAAVSAAANVKVDEKSSFEDKVSYSVGASVGSYIATIHREQSEFIGSLNNDIVIKGFIDALNSSTTLSDEEISDTLVTLDKKVREGVDKKQKADASKTLEEGKKFLEENAKKEGVKTTESGLQYKVLKEGKGKTPTPTDTVRVTYKGTLIDGTVFDEQQEPISFPLANIIPGWIEGLQLMKEGGSMELYIPSDLAYGEMAAGDLIKPNSTLVFRIDLVEVVAPEAKKK